jgi:hypothetical protein
MNSEHYSGKILCLAYPELLKVVHSDPRWFAASPDNQTTVAIEVDPDPAAAQGSADSVRSPHFTKGGGVKIDREGYLKLDSGLEGYERMARLVDAVGRVCTYSWAIDAKVKKHILNILITTVERDWQEGAIWESLLKSISIVKS